MAKPSDVENMDLPTLLKEIGRDTGTLVTQQVELIRAEVGQELRRAGEGAAAIAAGGGLAAAGGLLSGMMLAHLLERTTRLPLWMCYGAVGGGAIAASLALLNKGRHDIAAVQLTPPPETTEALKENATWLQGQVGLQTK
jgi:hypothetical protein